MKSYLFAAGLALASLVSLNAQADQVTFLGSGTAAGVAASASAKFVFTGNTLTITLTNTSPSNSAQDVPGSTLTGLFWNSVSNAVLTPLSATVAGGSSVIQTSSCSPTCATTNVGGEFGYQATSFPGGADRGIASAGYLTTNVPQNNGNFNGSNLNGNPPGIGGIDFGIVSSASGFNPNGGLSSVPLIQNSVIFVLTGVSNLTSADITNVSFQYGTSITEANVPGHPGTNVPEPSSLALVGVALASITALRRRNASTQI